MRLRCNLCERAPFQRLWPDAFAQSDRVVAGAVHHRYSDLRGGSVETWQWCAEMDYVYCYLSYYGYKAGQSTMTGFWEEMDRLGKDRNPYHAGFLQFVGVAETREEAYRLYREPAEYRSEEH